MSRTPRSRRTDPESRLLTTIRVGGTGLLVTGLLAGCGSPGTSAPTLSGGLSPVPAATQPGSIQPGSAQPDSTVTGSAQSGPAQAGVGRAGAGRSGAAGPEPNVSVTLPWPAADRATTTRLQRAVDNGTEPWLLDPAQVAISYVTAAYGWLDADARPSADGRTVDVDDSGKRVILTMTQPGRPGQGGIWVVTSVRPGG